MRGRESGSPCNLDKTIQAHLDVRILHKARCLVLKRQRGCFCTIDDLLSFCLDIFGCAGTALELAGDLWYCSTREEKPSCICLLRKCESDSSFRLREGRRQCELG